jgi:hypothetical protein
MKSLSKLLSSIVMIFMIFAQITPVFASIDGPLRQTFGSGSIYFRSGPSSSYSIIMNCNPQEALAYTGSSSNGYKSYKGWKSSTSSVVNGWVLDSKVAYYNNYSTKVALNMYNSESDGSYSGTEIPSGHYLNKDSGYFNTYSGLYYLYVQSSTNPFNNVTTARNCFVHTNFRSTYPSSYYIQNDGYPH